MKNCCKNCKKLIKYKNLDKRKSILKRKNGLKIIICEDSLVHGIPSKTNRYKYYASERDFNRDCFVPRRRKIEF
ncbi:hypothetical protein M0R19_08940 [Candidatus Pacearchaeota archaeon]|nr:hypothetical protein [Candidatus Pacearchaeota archaeon]